MIGMCLTKTKLKLHTYKMTYIDLVVENSEYISDAQFYSY